MKYTIELGKVVLANQKEQQLQYGARIIPDDRYCKPIVSMFVSLS